MSDTPTLTEEGGGFVATCRCGWLRWLPAKPAIAAAGRSHAEKCKGPAEHTDAPVARRGATNWKDREGATWIDKI